MLQDLLQERSSALRNAIRDGIAKDRQARTREAIHARLIFRGYVRERFSGPGQA